jgi:hypothetical protein
MQKESATHLAYSNNQAAVKDIKLLVLDIDGSAIRSL